MKNKSILAFIFILLAGLSYAGLIARATDTLGTCKLRDKTTNQELIYENKTEVDCRRMANDPANGVTWVGWTPSNTPTTSYNLLSPLPCPTGDPNCTGTTLSSYNFSDSNNISRYLNLMIKLFIGICAVLAVIMIIIGGLEYMTSELISNKEHGKERILHAIFGLILALGAWTILYQINPDLLIADLGKSMPGVTLEVDLESDVPQTAVNGKFGSYTANAPWDDSAGANTTIPAWASIKPPPCTKVGQQQCTSVRGLSLQYLNTIHNNCANCELVITEGTAFWLHGGKSGSTSHGVGSSTMDLRITPSLTAYITGGNETPVKWKRYTRNGISFLFEGNHWHAGP